MFIKYGINSYNRVNLIYGENKSDDHTCTHSNAEDKNNKPLPYGVDVNYIENYDTEDFKKLIKTILDNKANNNTPIIFIYDGHGEVSSGVMDINSSLNIDTNTFITLFSNNKNNKKLFIFSQCGSYGFYNSLNKSEMPNSVYICSTNRHGICGFGAGILRKFTELLKTEKYVRFNNMKSEIQNSTIFFLDDPDKIKIQDILKLYCPNITLDMFKPNDEIFLIANDKYNLGYDINKYRNLNSIIDDKTKLWFIKDKEFIKDKGLCFRFATAETYSLNSNNFNAYIDSYEINSNNLLIWNLNIHDLKKQFFKINEDFSVQSILDNYYLLYDELRKKFIRGPSSSVNLHLVKLSY